MEDNQATYDARDAFLMTLGEVRPDVLAPLINPSFMGGPRWPDLRQAWRVIQRKNGIAVLSVGLADPFDDTEAPNVGFGLEVIGETVDELPEPIQGSWLFDLVYGVSQQCAAHGGVADIVNELGIVSLELPATESLKPLETEEGRVGVLLGATADDVPRQFKLPGGSVLLLTATLITPTELQYVVDNGTSGREKVAELLAERGLFHRSSMTRASVI